MNGNFADLEDLELSGQCHPYHSVVVVVENDEKKGTSICYAPSDVLDVIK